jgi:hypothetical protein
MAALDEGAGLLEWAAGMTEVPEAARLGSLANHAGLLALRARSSFRVTGGISVARKDAPGYASRKPTQSGDDGLPPPATRGHPTCTAQNWHFVSHPVDLPA